MRRADFHMHSTISDGSDTIQQLIEKATQKGLSAIAITDHDTLSHVKQLPQTDAIQVIGGIEISAIDPTSGSKAHVLGYQIKNIELVESVTHPILEARNQNSEKQVAILIRNGYTIDADKLARADGKYLYKQHIMKWLVDTGQAVEMFGQFYQATFKNRGICDFDIPYVDVLEAVKIIKEAGGVAVLAHPVQQQNFDLIPSLVKVGLDGLEWNHPANGIADKIKLQEMAKEYQLFLTGGSDYHGIYEATTVEFGDYISHESGVEALCQK